MLLSNSLVLYDFFSFTGIFLLRSHYKTVQYNIEASEFCEKTVCVELLNTQTVRVKKTVSSVSDSSGNNDCGILLQEQPVYYQCIAGVLCFRCCGLRRLFVLNPKPKDLWGHCSLPHLWTSVSTIAALATLMRMIVLESVQHCIWPLDGNQFPSSHTLPELSLPMHLRIALCCMRHIWGSWGFGSARFK